MPRSWLRLARAGASLALVAGATGLARADGWSAIIQPGYINSSTTTTDSAGHVSHNGSSLVTQQYRLNLSDTIYPQLRLDLGGTYNWLIGTSTTDTVQSNFDAKTWTGQGRLTLGSPILNGGVTYDRLEQGSSTGSNGEFFRSPDVVHETALVFAGWHPSDLPTLDVRFSRTNNYDKLRVGTDLTSDEVFASTRYAPVPALDLRFSSRFSDQVDHIHQSETQDLSNSASVTWANRALDGRLTTGASYSIAVRNSQLVAQGAGGSVLTQQFPTAGLSAVETLPTPERITLSPNPAVIDGDTNISTGLDIGFGVSAGGDTAGREVGVQFADASTPVNLLYLWVDRSIPQEIAAMFTFAAYKSDDNATWTRIELATPPGATAPVQFSLFANRFEIGVVQTQARYLKIVATPLGVGVTTDRRFADIFITELQTVLAQSAALAARNSTDTSGNLNANLRYLIQRSWNVSYDFSGFLSHTHGLEREAYSLLNGLSFSRRVASAVNVSGRLDRTDSGGTDQPHNSLSRASATLAYDPLPTFGTGGNVSTSVSQSPSGTGLSTGLSWFARADLYQGINVSGNASTSFGYNELGQTVTGTLYGVSVSVTPNPMLAMTGAYNYTTSTTKGGGRPEQSDSLGRVEGSASFSPFRALYFAASVSRFTSGRPPSTLATFTAGFSPFPGGDLILRFGYTETLDQAAGLRVRNFGPSARWNIRRGAFLDLGYNVDDTHSPTVDSSGRTFTANLTINL
jgi:hypothetical protein